MMNKKRKIIYKLLIFILSLIFIIIYDIFFNYSVLNLDKIEKIDLLKLQR